MSESEYHNWSKRSRESFAAEKMRANKLTKAEADKVAEESFKKLLPDGLHSKDNFLFSARDENQNTLGFIWFAAQGAQDNRRAFVCDVVIEEKYRSQGYGKQIMRLAEEEAKKIGLNRIGLHVFGHNEIAVNLYKSLGYLTTDLVMEKSLI